MSEEMTGYIARNLCDFYALLAKHLKSTATADYIWLDEYPYSNLLYLKNPNPDTIKNILSDQNILAACPTLVFLNNHPEVPALLRKNRFIPVTRWKGMALYTPPSSSSLVNCGLRFLDVRTEKEMKEWEQVAADVNGFVTDIHQSLPFKNILKEIGIKFYTGYLDERPVCCGALFDNSVTAGVYFIGTLDEFRGKGYGTAITKWMLVHTRRYPAVLHASPDGAHMYMRMGFAGFCNFDLYSYIPDNE